MQEGTYSSHQEILNAQEDHSPILPRVDKAIHEVKASIQGH